MSKEEAIEILSEMRSEYNLFGDEEEATRYHVLSWAIKAINAKTGQWQHRKGSDCLECSQCHAVLENDDLGMHNFYFCYHCGAKMEVEHDSQ